MNCPLCLDRGFIIDSNKQQKKCVCQVKKELERFLAPVIQYPLVKDIDFSEYNPHLVITKGTERGFYSLVKSFMFRYYFENQQNNRQHYAVETGTSIIEMYLSDTEQKHKHLYTIPLLFVDLTKSYTNKAMGEIVLYTLRQRQGNDLPFWIYVGAMTKTQMEQIYNKELVDYLNSKDKLNIDKYSMKISQEA